jgi:hypothetical protein
LGCRLLPQIGGPCRIQDEASFMVCSGEQQKDVTEQVSHGLRAAIAACRELRCPLRPLCLNLHHH